MKVVVSLIMVLALLCGATPPMSAAPRQVLQGTEIHLTLLNAINGGTAKEGDPFVAVLAEPVALDSRILLPAGTRVNGTIGILQRAKNFSLFRGQAYMSLTFKSIELDSRLIPIQMSIIAIGQPRINGDSRRRRDVKISEGEVIQQKHDYRGDVTGVALGAGGGSLLGVVFSNVGRGLGLGFAAGAVYVVARKGKEIVMPPQTGMLVRLDSTVTLPAFTASILPNSGNSSATSR